MTEVRQRLIGAGYATLQAERLEEALDEETKQQILEATPREVRGIVRAYYVSQKATFED